MLLHGFNRRLGAPSFVAPRRISDLRSAGRYIMLATPRRGVSPPSYVPEIFVVPLSWRVQGPRQVCRVESLDVGSSPGREIAVFVSYSQSGKPCPTHFQ